MASTIRSGVAVSSPSKDWLRALELTAPIAKNPTRVLSNVIEEQAEARGDAPALLSGSDYMSYRELAGCSNRYTRWALEQGLGKGDTVCLVMANRPEYMAIWLGISRTGCAVALINTNLPGTSLAHSINVVAPKHIIAGPELAERVNAALPEISGAPRVWRLGEMGTFSADRLRASERRSVTVADRALYIYTSGTTGLPKAAKISHARLMQWSYWFAGLLDTSARDRLYNCLPMYHSVGGVLATGAMLVSGGSVVVRESFSASRFWSDIVRWDCTLFQYIGELCRYLLNSPIAPQEREHRLRACCGNGLRGDIWEGFQSRFRIPRVLEFYASTEGNVSLFNVEGKPGAIGRVPPFLAHRFPAALVKVDAESNEPVRNENGCCVPCVTDEAGEALGRIFEDPSNAGNRFEGYTSEEASAQKILHGVFEPDDAWFRTGDLMRKDKQGYFYFVDRIGDTFRWKGENVATAQVEEVCYAFPAIAQANVYGVTVPGAEGRAGMAAIVTREGFELGAFRAHLERHLPAYAQPLYLRIRQEMESTGTFKFSKSQLVHEGYDPASTSDAIYFNDRSVGAFVHVKGKGTI